MAALLGRSLHELGETLTSEEYSLWQEFMAVEPMGPAMLMPALGELLAALANGNLKPPQGRSAWRSADFFASDRWSAPVQESGTPSVADLRAFVNRRR